MLILPTRETSTPMSGARPLALDMQNAKKKAIQRDSPTVTHETKTLCKVPMITRDRPNT